MKVNEAPHAEIAAIILGTMLGSMGYLLMLRLNLFSVGLEDSVPVYYGYDAWIVWRSSVILGELDIPLVILPSVPLSVLSRGLLRAAKSVVAVGLSSSFVISSYHLLALNFPLKVVVVGSVMMMVGFLLKLLPMVVIITAVMGLFKRYRPVTLRRSRC
ncbi:MAG: hypothetical protein ACE5Z5_00735 [Candidatus Bathyarchaeia archaeon]